jgi:urease gamma subunit
MSDANTNKKSGSSEFNINSISGVLNVILTAFNIPEAPVSELPPPLILIGSKLRTGLSASAIAARIISRQSESGRQVGDVFADGPNVEEAMEVIRIQEIINAILTEAKIEIVVPPGVGVTTIGIGNLGAPVLTQGATTTMGVGSGVIR